MTFLAAHTLSNSCLRHAKSGRKAQSGFTLIETVVVLTTLAFLATLAMSFFHLAIKSWQKTKDISATSQNIETTQNMLRHMIEGMYPANNRIDGHTEVGFDGSKSAMRFITAAPAALEQHGYVHFTLSTQKTSDAPSGLFLHIDNNVNVANAYDTIIVPKQHLEFSYFGQQDGMASSQWTPEWHHQSHLPTLIRIAAADRQDAITWPTFYAAPHLTLDLNCAYNAATLVGCNR